MRFGSHFQNELNCNAINPTRQSRPRLHPQPRHTLPSNTALHSDIHSDSSVIFLRNCKCLAKRLQRLRDPRVMYVVCCCYGCTFVLRRIRLHSVSAPLLPRTSGLDWRLVTDGWCQGFLCGLRLIAEVESENGHLLLY